MCFDSQNDSEEESLATQPFHHRSSRPSHTWYHPQWRNKTKSNHNRHQQQQHHHQQHDVLPATKGPATKLPSSSPDVKQSPELPLELPTTGTEGEEQKEEEEEEEESEEGEVSDGGDPHSLELSGDDVVGDQWTSCSSQEQSGVDWGEVEAGKAAGMPGCWEPVEQDTVTTGDQASPSSLTHQFAPSSTQELLGALEMKAQAFADQEWQHYWSSAGPAHLAWSWRQQHPHISLTKVECVSGVDFLCQALQTHMTLSTPDQPDQPARCEETKKEEDGQYTVQHAYSESEEAPVEGPEVSRDEDVTTSMEGGGRDPNDTEVLAMWNEFYNLLYWTHYSWFRGGQGAVDSAGEKMVEEEEEEETLMEGTVSLPDKTVGPLHPALML